MLKTLSIRDFAIIESLELEFGPGLTVITGETGAGKSILLDALGLIAGARGEAAAVRPGAERAEVQAELDLRTLPELRAWLAERELDEGDAVQLRRVLRAEGSSKAFINGRAQPLSSLREVCARWLEIHGQHEFQALLERAHQLDLLDAYAQAAAELEAVRLRATDWRALQAELAALRQLMGQDNEVQAAWAAQLAELDALKLDPAHLAELDAEQRRLAHGSSVQAAMAQALARLEDGPASAQKQLAASLHELERVQAYEPRLAEILQRLESQRLEIEAAAADLADLLEGLNLDPRHLERIEAELSRVHSLARRHRVLPAQLAEQRDALRQRVAHSADAESRAQQLAARAAALSERYREAASALTRKRRQAAAQLAAAVSRLAPELGLQGARLELSFAAKAADEHAAQGAESCEFLVSTNPGQPLKPLRKVASGGELSRLSLAIKVATVDVQDIPVLVFDEVDAGIGGAVAEVVGQKLRELGRTRQVLCVTHLAQVAACGHAHLEVRKVQDADTTRATVRALLAAERIDELARMLGGAELTATTRAHAAELLVRASR